MVVSVIVLVVSVLIPVAVLLCAVGVIPRNVGVGIRIPATQASDEAWRAGHRAAVVPTAIGGVLSIVVACVGFATPGIGVAGLLPLVAGVLVGAALANRAA